MTRSPPDGGLGLSAPRDSRLVRRGQSRDRGNDPRDLAQDTENYLKNKAPIVLRGSLHRNLNFFGDYSRLRNRISKLTHAFQMSFDRLLHEESRLIQSSRRADASGQVRDMGAVSGGCWRIQRCISFLQSRLFQYRRLCPRIELLGGMARDRHDP